MTTTQTPASSLTGHLLTSTVLRYADVYARNAYGLDLYADGDGTDTLAWEITEATIAAAEAYIDPGALTVEELARRVGDVFGVMYAGREGLA